MIIYGSLHLLVKPITMVTHMHMRYFHFMTSYHIPSICTMRSSDMKAFWFFFEYFEFGVGAFSFSASLLAELGFGNFSLLHSISISLQCYAMSWWFQSNVCVTILYHRHHHHHRHQLLTSVYFYGDGRVDGKRYSITCRGNKIQLKWNACFGWSTVCSV